MVDGSVDGFQRLVDHLERLIKQMDAPVENHAAAVFGFLTPIAGDAAATEDGRFDSEDGTESTRFDNIASCKIIFVPTAVLVDRQEHSGGIGDGRHCREIGTGKRYWLFADDVFPGTEGFDCERLVKIVGSCDGYDVEVGIRQHSLIARIWRDTMFACELLPFFANIIAADEMEILDFGDGFAMPVAHTAQTADCDIELAFICAHNARR